MKNNQMHRSFIRYLSVLLLSLFVLNNLHAQTTPEHLWGTWELDTVEITKEEITEKHSLKNLLADLQNLPRDMFTRLYFIDDKIEINSTEEMFLPQENWNQKGSFSVEDNKLLIKLQREESRIFTYLITDDLLKIEFTRKETHFNLNYKLLKTIE